MFKSKSQSAGITLPEWFDKDCEICFYTDAAHGKSGMFVTHPNRAPHFYDAVDKVWKQLETYTGPSL